MAIQELDRYKRLWHTYKNSDELMPKYQKQISNELYTMNIHLANERHACVLSFDVDGIQQYLNHKPAKEIPIVDLEKIIERDLEISKESYAEVQKVVCKPNPKCHKYKTLIVLHFEELQYHCLLDGKHRYTECKLQKKSKITVKTINSFDASHYIVTQKAFVEYAILHNAVILTEYVYKQRNSLENLIRIENHLK